MSNSEIIPILMIAIASGYIIHVLRLIKEGVVLLVSLEVAKLTGSSIVAKVKDGVLQVGQMKDKEE